MKIIFSLFLAFSALTQISWNHPDILTFIGATLGVFIQVCWYMWWVFPLYYVVKFICWLVSSYKEEEKFS